METAGVTTGAASMVRASNGAMAMRSSCGGGPPEGLG
jgi:hypothetical protein